MTQCERIQRHLQDHGSITAVEALNEYGIARLAARISDLRRQGIEIKSETVVSKFPDGRAKHYSRYKLVEVQE